MTRNVPDSWGYCGKEETRLPGYEPFQLGQCPEVKAKGLTEAEKDELHMQAKAAMKRGEGEEWFEADPKRRRFYRGSGYQLKQDMLKRQEPARSHQDITIIWYVGGTGLGKSAAAFEFLKDIDYYQPPEGMPLFTYWDGYRGQKYMWIDDFDGWCNYRSMLKHFGGYQQRSNVKGTGTVARVHTFFVTSDISPQFMKWGMDVDENKRRELSPNQWAQLERRITAMYEFEAGDVNRPPWPEHPSGRLPQLIQLKNHLQIQPMALADWLMAQALVLPEPPPEDVPLLPDQPEQPGQVPPSRPAAPLALPPAPAEPSEQTELLQQGQLPDPAHSGGPIPPSQSLSVVSVGRTWVVPLLP